MYAKKYALLSSQLTHNFSGTYFVYNLSLHIKKQTYEVYGANVALDITFEFSLIMSSVSYLPALGRYLVAEALSELKSV